MKRKKVAMKRIAGGPEPEALVAVYWRIVGKKSGQVREEKVGQ